MVFYIEVLLMLLQKARTEGLFQDVWEQHILVKFEILLVSFCSQLKKF